MIIRATRTRRRLFVPVLDFSRSGGARVITEIVNRIHRMGFDPVLVAPRHSAAPYFPTTVDVMYVDSFGRVVPRSDAAYSGLLRPLRAMLGIFVLLLRRARKNDIILANHWTTTYAGLGAWRSRRIYYIQAYEADRYDRKGSIRERIGYWVVRGSYHLPYRHIVNAPIFIGKPPMRAENWVPPGIDLTIFVPKSALSGSNRESPVLGCIGRPELYKGTMDVLDAFRIVRQRYPKARLLIAFGTDDMAASAGPGAETVHPHGDSNLAAFYRSVDVMCAVGTVELGGCHYPVLESMASGTPVVTTGYLPATSANAWIVPVHSPESIASAVQSILEDQEGGARRVVAALADVAAFNWDAVVGALGLELAGNSQPRSKAR